MWILFRGKYKIVIIWILQKNFPSYLTEDFRISGRTETPQAKNACIQACVHSCIHPGRGAGAGRPRRVAAGGAASPPLGAGTARAAPESLGEESGCVRIIGLECSPRLRVMFSEHTTCASHTYVWVIRTGSLKHSCEEKLLVGRVHFVILS